MIPYNQQSYFAPYLSDTVMQSVIEKENVLNNAMVRDVLVANPQSAKSPELMQKLDERIEPMPDYMKEEIANGAIIVSPKEKLEADIYMGKAEAEGWYNRMIGEQLTDTTGNAGMNLDNLFELRQRASNEYYKALKSLEEGQPQSGLNTLESIPATYGLNSQQIAEHNNLVESYELLSSAQLNVKPVQQMDSMQVHSFKNHINNLESLGENWLRNSLVASGNLNSTEQYILPDFTKSSDVEIAPREKNKTTNESLKVFPNPTKEYIIIEYRISNAVSKGILITDGTGRTVDKLTIRKDADQLLYITKNLKPGIYICRLISGNAFLGSLKLTILK